MKTGPARSEPKRLQASLVAAILAWPAITLAVVAADQRPNGVVVLADDLGYADLRVQGAMDIATPNIEALAASGVRFTNGYATWVACAPSRAALLAGRDSHRFGFYTNPTPILAEDQGFPPGFLTVPRALQRRGYGMPRDGVDLLPFLSGQSMAVPPARLHWKDHARGAIREGRFKLHTGENVPQAERYDLAVDLRETRSLAAAPPEVVRRLDAAWKSWNAEIKPPLRQTPPREEWRKAEYQPAPWPEESTAQRKTIP